jgi:hypothetical protein
MKPDADPIPSVRKWWASLLRFLMHHKKVEWWALSSSESHDPKADPISSIEEWREFLRVLNRVLFFFVMRHGNPPLTRLTTQAHSEETRECDELFWMGMRYLYDRNWSTPIPHNSDDWTLSDWVISTVSVVISAIEPHQEFADLPSKFRPRAEDLCKIGFAVKALERVIKLKELSAQDLATAIPAALPEKPAPESVPPKLPFFRLGEPGEKPIVNGKRKKPLTCGRYDLVKALYEAGPRGLKLAELEKLHKGAAEMIKEMRKDPDWRAVILTARKSWGHYKLHPRCFDEQ